MTVTAAGAWLANLGNLRTRLAPGASRPQIRAIAVLPLRNISRDPDQEYFADGMTEALTTSLAQISALNVIARTSAMRYQGTQKTSREIAQELHVDAVVEGATQRSGNRVLITAQLIEGSSDRHLWAKSYERDLLDMLALQNDVAQAIAQEIQVTLTPQEQARLTKVRPVNPEAQEAYLRGVYWDQKGDIPKAFDYFRQATEKDPNYAAAHAALAGGYGLMMDIGRLSAKEAYPKWRAAVNRALQVDGALAEAHSSLADLLQYHDWNWGEAEREYQRAIQLNPNFALAHLWYSWLLTTTGRHDEAIVEARKAQQLDPYSFFVNLALGQELVRARRDDEAIEQARRLLDFRADAAADAAMIMGLAYEQKGDLEHAISELQQAVKLGKARAPIPSVDDQYLANLAHAYGVSGSRRDALQLLAELTETSKQRPVPSWAFAIIYAGLGDKDRAFESLRNVTTSATPT